MPSLNDRRRFLQLMGASLALAGQSGCRYESENVLPHARRPIGHTPGEARHYATCLDLAGTATGLVVKSIDGRPAKVEGNALPPGLRGASSALDQASVLELYDPDRSRRAPWDAFAAFARPRFGALAEAGGQGLWVLSEASSSPSLADLQRRLLRTYPGARWVEYEPLSRDHEREGSRLAFGAPYRTHAALDRAKVVLSLDADLFGDHPAALQHAAGFFSRREPETGEMSRLYVVESALSVTGGVADHRLALPSRLIKALAAALDHAVGARAQPLPEWGAAQPEPAAPFLNDPDVQRFMKTLTHDLLAQVGQSVIVAGARQPREVHALTHRLNRLLGNPGQTMHYTALPDAERKSHFAALAELTAAMQADRVHTLVMLGGNPVFTAPADLPFADALAKVACSIHLSLHEDETSARATWHLPRAHPLEAWGDGRAADGTVYLAQPLMAPLHHGRSALELLALLCGDELRSGRDIVQRTHTVRLSDERRWRQAVHDGVLADSRPETSVPDLVALPRLSFEPPELGGLDASNGELELVFAADSKVYDGRFANNAWLQELPDPVSKQSWGNAAWIAPGTARKLGIEDAALVELTLAGRTLVLPAVIVPGQAPGSVRVTLGYGRTAAGHVGGLPTDGVAPVGANTYALRTSQAPYVASGLHVRATGEDATLAITQLPHGVDSAHGGGSHACDRGIIRESTLDRFRTHPNFAQPPQSQRSPQSPWQPPAAHDGHRWGLSIDLGKCTGCNACVIACQAENNVPVVGPEQVHLGREMHWLRIDRYFCGEGHQPLVSHQPVACQHCENAPCEQVCPVGATLHSREGLNEMAYQRCIGARYCSNNCPYKVRRFNYFDYPALSGARDPLSALGLNPDVSVRSRGVMEKCSLCVQRIEQARIKARNAGRRLADGDIHTACQQACPTGAIAFGDLADPASQVARRHAQPRSYGLLEQLHTQPRIRYLARVRNPNPRHG